MTARDLGFARMGETIFGPVSFALRGGDVMAVGGANGAGKTTLLNVLAGLIAPTMGSLESELGNGEGAHGSGRVALVGHHNGLKLDLSARANLRFRAALQGARELPSVDGALAHVGLAGYESLALRELSAGQRRRVALAALARSQATLWLLDEPFANLDADGRALVSTLIAAQRERGGMVVLTTHGADLLPADTAHCRLGAAS